MFPARFFTRRYWAARYWPKIGATIVTTPRVAAMTFTWNTTDTVTTWSLAQTITTLDSY